MNKQETVPITQAPQHEQASSTYDISQMSKIAARNPDLIREQLEADFDTIQREHKRKDLAQRQFMLKTFNDCAS